MLVLYFYCTYFKKYFLTGTTGQAYHDGGYICDLGLTHKESNVIMTQLIDNRWVDQLTRVLFIEFVLYNINTDVTSLVYLMAEKMPSEAFFSRIEVIMIHAVYNSLLEFINICQMAIYNSKHTQIY